MTIRKFLTAALLAALTLLNCSSCALESEKAAAKAKADAEAAAARKAAAAAEALKNPLPVISETLPSAPEPELLDFADPDTTKELITAETTKTVTGPAVKKEDAPDEGSVINVAPPLPSPQLPEPKTN